MRLKTVRVTEFKSIQDSGDIDIGDVTCLVGKNEAGKTALLQALYRLNPLIPQHAVFNVTEDYPRIDVEDYQQDIESKKRQPATAVRAVFELSAAEIAAIENDFGKGILATPDIELSRRYTDPTLYFTVTVNERVAIKHLLTDVELTAEARNLAEGKSTVKDLLAYLHEVATSQEAEYKNAITAAAALADAHAQAHAKDEATKLKETESAKQLRADLATYNTHGFSKFIWNEYISPDVPKFLYFDEYYQMDGQVNVQKLKERQSTDKLHDSDRPMLGLIDLARLNLDLLLAATNTQELLNKLEGASVHLSKQVLKYWSQNKHIRVTFDLRQALPQDPEGMRDGVNLWGFVHDTKHLATTRLGTRSRGFVWFFSFLAWFSQQRKLDKPLILLLDEPGLFLHASAQDDLLRYIEEELKPHHQVIFTTHSPFMVNVLHFSRVRIVRDKSMESDVDLPKEEQGTKVFTDVLEADEGSLFPLQGALGYDIAQTLFVGPDSLIVEGVSDLIFIQTINGTLPTHGRQSLSSLWTITPVGGSDKVPTFVALLGAQKKLKLATLIDIQPKDEQQIQKLYKKKLLNKAHVCTFADFTGTNQADIEDMFDPSFYLDLVNAEYIKELQEPIKLVDLPSRPRIVLRIEEYLKTHPLKAGHFSHYRPARYFSERTGALAASMDAATLDRFESAFKALNALL